MRAEASPHVDVLEFEKGREADSDVANLFVLQKVMELVILLLILILIPILKPNTNTINITNSNPLYTPPPLRSSDYSSCLALACQRLVCFKQRGLEA